MLDWVGAHVSEINSLMTNGAPGSKVELLACDGTSMVVITRRGPDDVAAFRKCVRAGMRQIPERNPE